MKRQIRRGVFETNSSSTHSVSIFNTKTIPNDIPKNSKVIIDDKHEKDGSFYDEIGKLKHVVTMLASIVDRKHDYEDLVVGSFEEMINLNWFKWLAEVVKEESNTEIIYECPKNWEGKAVTYVPYYDTTYDEYDSIEDIFTDNDKSILSDETKFKARVKDIIYNPYLAIEDREEER